MRYLPVCGFILLLLFVSGCANVVSKYPMGTKTYKLSSDALNGTWFNEEEFIKIRVMDEEKGIFKLVWLEEKDNDFRKESVTCQVMKDNGDFYLTVLEIPDDAIEGFYYWGKVQIENRKILFWLPSFDAFKEAFNAHKINAIVDKTKADSTGKQKLKNIKLIDEPKQVLALIKANEWQYFDFKNPIVLMKLPK